MLREEERKNIYKKRKEWNGKYFIIEACMLIISDSNNMLACPLSLRVKYTHNR
jgi:hypothetical protein